jgi:zinc transport system permease protein
MKEILEALSDPNVAFFRYAVFAGIIASVSFGIVGSFVVVRRISYIAAAIAHSILGGIGAALWLHYKFRLDITPETAALLGSIIAALGSAIIIGLVSLRAREREDTIIGAIWATGMAVGLLFLFKTPGQTNAESYLFGELILVGRGDLALTAILAVIVVSVSVLFYHHLVAVCFDEEFARLRGINVTFYFLLLLCLVGLSVVLLVRLTGIILAIALIVLPAATASRFSRRLGKVMLGAVLLSMLYTTAGLMISYSINTAAGPIIVLLAALAYVIVITREHFRPS